MKNVDLTLRVDSFDLVEALVHNLYDRSHNNAKEVIIAIDEGISEYDFTFDLAKHFIDVLTKAYDLNAPTELDQKIVEFNEYLKTVK